MTSMLVLDARRTGSILVAFGSVGLVVLVACLAAVVLALAPLANEATILEQQRSSAVALIAPAADALETTATSAEDAGASLGQSVTAARDAASVTGQLADALGGLATFSSAFGDTAARSRALSDDLSRTATALAQNQTDSATAAAELRTLADRLRQLDESLAPAGAASPSALSGAVLPLAIGLVALALAWLGGIAVASIWLGRRLRGS
jgi:hypothetical protein